jgi:hypothetical protein
VPFKVGKRYVTGICAAQAFDLGPLERSQKWLQPAVASKGIPMLSVRFRNRDAVNPLAGLHRREQMLPR